MHDETSRSTARQRTHREVYHTLVYEETRRRENKLAPEVSDGPFEELNPFAIRALVDKVFSKKGLLEEIFVQTIFSTRMLRRCNRTDQCRGESVVRKTVWQTDRCCCARVLLQ
jgi:hypothetical protein